ncbi:MAG TPA: hypothetical protein PK620_07640 [Denitromonas sp.]|uniref:hypothetical protein n=1 Tax=Denitromonas sp. TaxID=2734609 RepID=UPI001DE28741|nr:hypothetical protein [Rhodocyclaceae bacterium]MCP5221722.1 hypothetical protein [Zoogloeaceae bacterium]HQU88521.1 hypothetical protein [Denitromonas sp.]HQV14774.1 hypothetical protein [Denitromonas sp.]
MNALKTLTIAAFCLLVAGPVAARASVPIVNHAQITWAQGGGQQATPDQVRDAIIRACQEKGWTVTPTTDADTLIATLVVRNKHTIQTSISYSANTFSVTYAGSTNMNYAIKEPNPYTPSVSAGDVQVRTEVIHPNYNRWVSSLVSAIRSRLAP